MSPYQKFTVGYTLKQLKNPTEEQIDRSADIFADLTKDDIAIVGLCGGDAGLFKPLGLAMIRAGILDGQYYAATNDKDEILGYVMTMPKGKVLFSTDEQKKLGLNDFMGQLSEEGKGYYKNTYLKHFPQLVANCIAPLTIVDVWWIHMVMTESESQKQGIATGLVRMVCDKATAAGDTVALSTTSAINVPIYEGMGFKLIGQKDSPSPWGDWSMWVFRYEPTTTK